MNLKPLMDRLKRTGAPTVEDCTRWRFWLLQRIDGDVDSVCISSFAEGQPIEVWCDDLLIGETTEFPDGWTPIPSRNELLALAALPGKVAEAVRQTDLAVAHDGDYGYIAGKIREVAVLVIIEECAK